MNYDNLSVSGSLRVNYEKYLFPFEIFQVKIGVLTLPVTSSSKYHYNQSSCGDSPDKTEMMDEQLLHGDYEPKFIQSDVEERTPVSKRNNPRRSKRKRLEDPDYIFQLTEEHPEFKKLAFVAPGPKNDFCLMNNKKDTPPPTKSYKGIQTYGSVSSSHTDTDGSATVDRHGVVPTGDECCIECGDGCSYGNYLSCSSCNSCYHTFCLITELPMMPVSNWYCYQCIAKECCDPPEAFGFEQAKRVHSLQTFGQMANQFKADFFNQTPTVCDFIM
jgi:histone demethylase JARID1